MKHYYAEGKTDTFDVLESVAKCGEEKSETLFLTEPDIT